MRINRVAAGAADTIGGLVYITDGEGTEWVAALGLHAFRRQDYDNTEPMTALVDLPRPIVLTDVTVIER